MPRKQARFKAPFSGESQALHHEAARGAADRRQSRNTSIVAMRQKRYVHCTSVARGTMRSLSLWMVFAGLTVVGCTPTPIIGSNTGPEDLSSGGHRAEAARHAQEAQYDSEHSQAATARADTASDSNSQDDAIAQQREAQTHLRDAALLERTMQTDCASVAVLERPRCSFGSHQVAAVDDLPTGVRVRFAPGGDTVPPTLARVQCTHSYADYAGRDTMPSCVLAIRDLAVDVREELGAVVLVLTSANAVSVTAVRLRAHVLAPAAANVAIRSRR